MINYLLPLFGSLIVRLWWAMLLFRNIYFKPSVYTMSLAHRFLDGIPLALHKPGVNPGFTLAEVIVAMTVLGVVSAFTIPKVLSSYQSQQFTAITKETMSTLSQAVQKYNLDNPSGVNSTTTLANIAVYMNYIKLETGSVNYDDTPNYSTMNCSYTTCYRLHNGAILWAQGGNSGTFTGWDNGKRFTALGLDPDGKANGTKSIYMVVYTNGRIVTSYDSPVFAEPNPDWWR